MLHFAHLLMRGSKNLVRGGGTGPIFIIIYLLFSPRLLILQMGFNCLFQGMLHVCKVPGESNIFPGGGGGGTIANYYGNLTLVVFQGMGPLIIWVCQMLVYKSSLSAETII